MLVARVLAVLVFVAATAASCPPEPQGTSSVWTWGFNDVGQIGDGTKFRRLEPVHLPISDVTHIAAGFHYSLARKRDGSVWQWGSLNRKIASSTPCPDPNGAAGFIACDLTPTPVPNLAKVKAVGAGADFALAVMDDGNSSVCRWGQNEFGQLGNSARMPVADPVCSTPPDRVLHVDGGGGGRFMGGHALAISSGPPELRVWSWGRDEHKQVANVGAECPPFACVTTPTLVPGLVDVIGAAAGNEHSLALKVDGSVWAWGSQDYGQLGVPGANKDAETPVRVMTTGTNPPIPLDGVSDIAAGGDHSLALKSGKVWTWGFNNFGQIGASTAPSTIQLFARQVPGLDQVSRIAAGDGFSLALKSDGTVWAWGRNDLGQLGAQSNDKCGPQLQLSCSYSPIQVSNVTGVTAIAAGGLHSLALATP